MKPALISNDCQAAIKHVKRDEATRAQEAGGHEGRGSRQESQNGQNRNGSQQGDQQLTIYETERVKQLLCAELVVSRDLKETWTFSPLGGAVFKGNELMFQRIYETYEFCGGEWDGDTVRGPRPVQNYAVNLVRLFHTTSDTRMITIDHLWRSSMANHDL